jgi:hypothetical protein
LTLPRENWPRSATVSKLRRTLSERPFDSLDRRAGRLSRVIKPN